jgi:sugar lactone lactonase YvrE
MGNGVASVWIQIGEVRFRTQTAGMAFARMLARMEQTTERWTAEPVAEPGAELGESPLWDAEAGQVLWLDISNRLLHRYDPRSGALAPTELSETVTAIEPRAAGGMVAAIADGFALFAADGTVEPVVRIPLPASDSTMNDGCCDPAGRFLAGSTTDSQAAGVSALYCLDAERQVSTVLTGVTESNGLEWSLDGRTMYHVDTGARTLSAYDYDLESGAASNRRILRTFDTDAALPDGLALDTDGCLWLALWDGGCVVRLDPEGNRIGVVEVPTARPTSCVFGGAALDELYVTSAVWDLDRSEDPHAGSLFVARPGVTGLRARSYAG